MDYNFKSWEDDSLDMQLDFNVELLGFVIGFSYCVSLFPFDEADTTRGRCVGSGWDLLFLSMIEPRHEGSTCCHVRGVVSERDLITLKSLNPHPHRHVMGHIPAPGSEMGLKPNQYTHRWKQNLLGGGSWCGLFFSERAGSCFFFMLNQTHHIPTAALSLTHRHDINFNLLVSLSGIKINKLIPHPPPPPPPKKVKLFL